MHATARSVLQDMGWDEKTVMAPNNTRFLFTLFPRSPFGGYSTDIDERASPSRRVWGGRRPPAGADSRNADRPILGIIQNPIFEVFPIFSTIKIELLISPLYLAYYNHIPPKIPIDGFSFCPYNVVVQERRFAPRPVNEDQAVTRHDFRTTR